MYSSPGSTRPVVIETGYETCAVFFLPEAHTADTSALGHRWLHQDILYPLFIHRFSTIWSSPRIAFSAICTTPSTTTSTLPILVMYSIHPHLFRNISRLLPPSLFLPTSSDRRPSLLLSRRPDTLHPLDQTQPLVQDIASRNPRCQPLRYRSSRHVPCFAGAFRSGLSISVCATAGSRGWLLRMSHHSQYVCGGSDNVEHEESVVLRSDNSNPRTAGGSGYLWTLVLGRTCFGARELCTRVIILSLPIVLLTLSLSAFML